MTKGVRMGLGAVGAALLAAAFLSSDWTWLKAQLGGNDSQLILANSYAKGLGGLEPDPVKAFHWYLRAAQGGDHRGQQEVARRYDEGDGVEPNSDEATHWYQASADQANPVAQLAMARRHREGRGVPQDNVRAAMWLILSDQLSRSQPGAEALRAELDVLRDALQAELDENQLAQARGLAAEWRSAHGIVQRRIDANGKPIEEPAAPPAAPEAAAGAAAPAAGAAAPSASGAAAGSDPAAGAQP